MSYSGFLMCMWKMEMKKRMERTVFFLKNGTCDLYFCIIHHWTKIIHMYNCNYCNGGWNPCCRGSVTKRKEKRADSKGIVSNLYYISHCKMEVKRVWEDNFKQIFFILFISADAYMRNLKVLFCSFSLISPTSMVLVLFYVVFHILLSKFFFNVYSFFISIIAILVQTGFVSPPLTGLAPLMCSLSHTCQSDHLKMQVELNSSPLENLKCLSFLGFKKSKLWSTILYSSFSHSYLPFSTFLIRQCMLVILVIFQKYHLISLFYHYYFFFLKTILTYPYIYIEIC